MSDLENQAGAPAETAAPSISIQDLQNAVKVIDYACEQGAFKGWQVIEQVIGVRAKLVTFLEAAAPAQAEVPAEAAAPKAKATKKTATKKAK